MAHTLEFTTSLPCMNHCKFCPQDLLREKYEGEQMMSLQQFVAILNKVPKHVNILFAGFSEPFTNRQSSTMMKYAFKQGYEVCLFSTLVGCTDIDISIISGINFKSCAIHIPDNINFIVKDEDKWIEIYKKFKSKITITENQFHIGRPSERIKEVTVWGANLIVQSRANTVDPNIAVNQHKKGILKCPAGRTGVVLPNGDVVLCCMDYGLKHKLGNLITDSYEDLYKGAEYTRVIAGMTDERIDIICRYCYTQEGDVVE